MESKKAAYQNNTVTPSNELPVNEAIPKHSHQHNTAPQHLRLLQYGLKIPNHQINQNHAHQQLNSPLHLHVHQHNSQIQYQTTTHRHLQPSPQFNNINIHSNPVLLHNSATNQKYGHIHQQKPNIQPLYQTTQPPPPPAHPYNQMTQNTPQIWVPHQPPVHYHQQQQNKTETLKQNNTTPPQLQAKPKEVLERKKSCTSNSQQLRSPAAKRPPEAPVTMQGWLHKQGSEGLMLWKRRWFVLSEYCLFYYKGPEEEKLLGSILLPSYKVSICGPEDKVNKKFSFKCEHANMRTYILAADSQELMSQWIKVLNLACNLQNNIEHEQPTPNLVQTSATEENSEPIYLHNPTARTTPVHTHSSSNTTDLSNPSQQELSQYNQPLYANAPPKPRRLNDGGYSSPSPDILDRYSSPQNLQYIQPMHGCRNLAKSPVSIYGHTMLAPHNMQSDCMPHVHNRHNPHEYVFTPTREMHNVSQNSERRTPDTYGRSQLTTKSRGTDYEDVYADQTMYKRPLSPIAYSHINVIKKANPTINPAYRAYTPVNMLGPKEIDQYGPPQMRKSPSTIARPHSADFLEYEINHRQQNAVPAARPKSSLDINRNDSDNYFYSEERYAEKMRKSAQYLQKAPLRYSQHNEFLIQPKPLPIHRYPENESTYPLMRSNTQPINCNNIKTKEIIPNMQPVRSRSVLSEGSLSKELDVDLRSSPRDRLDRESISPGFSTRQEMYNYAQNMRNREYDQFTRSASARLAQNPSSQGERYPEERPPNREGDRKREESMKRLLEWKQRMLQSPLNRKVQGNRAYAGRNSEYYQENGYVSQKHMEPCPDGRRSVNNLPQYNSYSSDDEENEERSKENVHSQAGRTLDTFPSISESLSPAHTISTTVFNSLGKPDEFVTPSDLLHENSQFLQSKSSPEDLVVRESDENTFTKPLKQFNKESSNLAHVSSLRSEYSDKFEQSPAVTEIKSNGALVKSILAEFEKKLDSQENDSTVSCESAGTLTNDLQCTTEENYMTMTAKKAVLGPRSSNNSDATIIFNEPDENPYVEMTQNINSLLADCTTLDSNEQQAYEIVCFQEGSFEPVYMELKQPEANSLKSQKKKEELPDILMSPKQKITENKSDSSDADDEASKDLDSLDTPSQPRFSLSDTFRPASYYLGASQTVPEFQDSSDSELVSPPPIPNTPPPIDDDDNTEEGTNITNKEQSTKDETYGFSLQLHRNSDQFFNSTNTHLFNSTSNYIKGSTQSLDTKKTFMSYNAGKDANSSSVGSINVDTDTRYSSRLSHNSDSDVELRMPRIREYERMLKRRPVSEDFCDELESMDGTFETNDTVDLDRYLKDLQISNISLASNEESNEFGLKNHDYENLFIGGFPKKIEKSTPVHSYSCVKSPSTSHNTLSLPLDSTDRQLFSGEDYILRGRPGSSASTSAEICGLLRNSNCSTPSIRIGSSMSTQEMPMVSSYFSDRRDKSLNSSFNQPAPYYYSDLSVNLSNTDCPSNILTLNNQRGDMNGSKRDITHIINPLKCNSQIINETSSITDNEGSTLKLAVEARSVSVDFLNLTDKSGHIDKKNIYESDTLKRQKTSDSALFTTSNPETRNFYPIRKNDKFTSNSEIVETECNVRRSHSLEGLLENVLSESLEVNAVNDSSTNDEHHASEGSYLWEEDSIWRERLRTASQRHTKSMEDLDCIEDTKKVQKKTPRGITRGVVYVNDNFFNMPIQDKLQKENKQTGEHRKNEIKKEGSFIIDREKLRQWDLLSSAPSEDQLSTIVTSQVPQGNNAVVDIGDGNSEPLPENTNTQKAASGSISLNTRDTFPRTISAKRIWTPNSQNLQARSVTNLNRNEAEQYLSQPQGYFVNQSNQHESDMSFSARKENWQGNDNKMNVSAGELLGRTHEELVLLLIQLRRQSAQTLQAIENCYNEIDTIQAQIHLMDQQKRLENLQKLEQIKQHLLELEKQYEKGKPLVNLVDNMVKLGSLYRVPNDHSNINPYIRDRLEFNQQIQERRLLAEEKRDWNRITPNHYQLQEKVQQLYQLDRLIQEESGTLQNLQQDKEDIERALGGLRLRINKGFNDPAEVEQARKQQLMLENELSRVHFMLAQNSKKLEETVAGNARLEQELLVLKQKLQTSRQQRSSPQFSNAGDSLPCVVGTNVMLESDLHRVQKKIGDLQKQRQELSMQVRQLTDRSNNLSQIKSSNSNNLNNLQSLGNKKKVTSSWRETDLDTMSIVDHGETWEITTNTPTTPLYINTDIKQNSDEYYNRIMKSSDSTSDDTTQHSNLPPEKQEIKTVRIVKRESERRQRDREKITTTTSGKWDALLEEDDSSQNSSILFRPTPVQKTQSSTALSLPGFNENDKSSALIRENSVSSTSLPQYNDTKTAIVNSSDRSPELSPIFKSEAARQIITEMSIQDTPKKTNRRAVPKEKRRHYTAPHNNLIMKSLNQLPTDDNAFDKMILNTRRARDDLDMERALRQRIDAPDVVRSTLSNKELKYNESTIDNLLGTPNKINIPERYIPEQLPQLSAEEQEQRLRKVESIKKMLSDTAIISGTSSNPTDEKTSDSTQNIITNKATTKMIEEKKQREHLLQLNQILAKQVMEMSKIVAVKALQKLPLQPQQLSTEDEDSSPITPLPLYQQRDNFYS